MAATQKIPLVSIGLAVYNGENYLREALDALLSQTWTDFELIISDNASTDRTQQICLEYAARDSRIIYHRNDRNVGGVVNLNSTIQKARGKYLKLAAHDDLFQPDFLRQCVEVLEKNPEIVLCCSKTRLIDEAGQLYYGHAGDVDMRYVELMNADLLIPTDHPAPSKRFAAVLTSYHYFYPIFGVIRMDAVRKLSRLIGTYAGGDSFFLARLALLGPFYEVPEVLSLLRRHPNQSLNLGTLSLQLYSIWFDTSNRGKLVFPAWSRLADLLEGIFQAPLSFLERLKCLFLLLQITNYKTLIKDLVVSIVQIADWIGRRILPKHQRLPDHHESHPENLLWGRYPRLE